MDSELLDRSLARIQSGEATLSEILSEHPNEADELQPLLWTALATRRELISDGPSASYRANSTKRLMNLLRATTKRSRVKTARRLRWSWKPAYALASLLLAFSLLASSFGVAYASEDALPGDALYGVKRALERVSLAFSTSAVGDSRLLIQHAERRLQEVEQLIALNRQEDLGTALGGYEDAVSEALDLAGDDAELLNTLESALEKHQQVLEGVIAKAPEQALPGLTRALERSQHGKQVVEQIRNGGDPRELAPGQLRKTQEAEQDPSDLPPGQQQQTPGGPPEAPPGQVKKTETPNE
jgi:hypothetical protein